MAYDRYWGAGLRSTFVCGPSPRRIGPPPGFTLRDYRAAVQPAMFVETPPAGDQAMNIPMAAAAMIANVIQPTICNAGELTRSPIS